TILRRVRRRMALRNIERLTEYVSHLQKTPAELQALYQDLLIRVTSFFREPAAFQALKELIFPRIAEARPPDAPIRIWVACCATGEEGYSVAISLFEFLGETANTTPIKILATDISDAALEKARSGMYVENIELDVSTEQLRRFFLRIDGNYQITKTIRDMCVFS